MQGHLKSEWQKEDLRAGFLTLGHVCYHAADKGRREVTFCWKCVACEEECGKGRWGESTEP